MLQRAASNAYTWWWASHVRTKQSKWLEQSLLEMEEKVGMALQIIDQEGDSFAKRAEMYYKKRPELVLFVEESFKAFRALAERYDHLSRDLQSANRKIAAAFPEEVPFDVDDDDFDELSTATPKSDKKTTDGSKSRVPKVPAAPGKNYSFRTTSRLMSRKGSGKGPGHLRRISTFAKPGAMPAPATSGLSKDEAMSEIDKLQKEILSFQTEKEFVKSSFERGRERYWEIENRIMEMQRRVCSLQDEFEIGIVIEDSDARKLMASTALNSCRDSLTKLQERHRKSEEEVKAEEERIDKAYERFEAIRGVAAPRRHDDDDGGGNEIGGVGEDPKSMQQEMEEIEKIDDHLSVPELAEKIDDLVDKVVNLEVKVNTQSASVGRLRSETEHLLSQIHKFEDEYTKSAETGLRSAGDNKMSKQMNEFEADLNRVKRLKEQVLKQCQGLLSEFKSASSNLNQLTEKLENVTLDDEVEMSGLFREAKVVPKEVDEDKKKTVVAANGSSEATPESSEAIPESSEAIPGSSEAMPESSEEMPESSEANVEDNKESDGGRSSEGPEEEVLGTSGPTTTDVEASSEKPHDQTLDKDPNVNVESDDDQPNWRQLFLSGIEDREKILLEEYTSILRSYKDVKNKLSEAEKKNRDEVFELRELRNTNEKKEEELKALRQKLGVSNDHEENPNPNPNSNSNQTNPKPKDPNLPKSASARLASVTKQPLYKLLLRQSDRYARTQRSQSADGDIHIPDVTRSSSVVPLEEKVRAEIDDLLEENMEFWMRFSTSIQQIQKFQSSFHDLEAEMLRLKINKKQPEGANPASAAEARAIYKHLREIQTEMKFWLEHHTLLNEELQSRCTTLGNIQDEVSRSLENGSSRGGPALTEYQAAKLQGEVLNMRQESNKVAEELEAGQARVRKLQVDIDKALLKLDDYLGLSTSKNNPSRMRSSSTRSRIPLRYFLFGVKLKKQKQSIFACMSPAMDRQGSEITAGFYYK